VVGVASDADEAYTIIDEHRPNLLLLDIEIANGRSTENTFDLLARLPIYRYEIVFITAFDHYALNAIKARALDYLLKPLSITELQNAVSMARNRLFSFSRNLHELSGFPLNFDHKDAFDTKSIWILYNNEYIQLDLTHILRFEAEGRYTYIITEKKKYFITKNLKEYIDLLSDSNQFFQVHRSYLINLNQIEKLQLENADSVVMKDSVVIPIARRRKQDFLDKLSL
ncbi:MAG: response regulator transcription factor, partial [Saprospiraceae bacterium]|nr:response regulator transcription factor [Saprospiraceae bacterium]